MCVCMHINKSFKIKPCHIALKKIFLYPWLFISLDIFHTKKKKKSVTFVEPCWLNLMGQRDERLQLFLLRTMCSGLSSYPLFYDIITSLRWNKMWNISGQRIHLTITETSSWREKELQNCQHFSHPLFAQLWQPIQHSAPCYFVGTSKSRCHTRALWTLLRAGEIKTSPDSGDEAPHTVS